MVKKLSIGSIQGILANLKQSREIKQGFSAAISK
jgi:hypothetical protein